MLVDVWSDVVCPWCYIGKRRLEAALEQFDHRAEVEVRWRSYQLDPFAPVRRDGDPAARLAGKYGLTYDQAVAAQERLTRTADDEGIEFHLDRAKWGNTLDAHRLLHLAGEAGIQDAVKERLLAAYFTEGQPIGEPETLLSLVVEAGLERDAAREVLDSDRFAGDVRADEAAAAALGVTGVPFFVFGGRYAVGGAQPADLLLQVLERAWAETLPAVELVTPDGGAGAAACTDERCDL
ncbi:MAG TPA: DsbA family oxidoreductase [Thermoleophilia bacterium]|nr:DsbA family oxidoreductase [Thermoleophilia bacterium]